MDHPVDIGQGVTQLNLQLKQTCQRLGRDPKSVCLLAISKTHSHSSMEQAWFAGQRHFGESYWQEMETKINLLAQRNIVWHFIGRLQARKARAMANLVDWVHSISRVKTAQLLSQARSNEKPPLDVCLQVNLSGEPQKDGVEREEAQGLADEIAEMPRLRLRGLMTILPYGLDETASRRYFAQLFELNNRLSVNGDVQLDTLSMGMSHDWQWAVAEGATIIRVGSALFGQRRSPSVATQPD